MFISYSRANKALAEALAADIHALGHQAFYDRDLTGGQRWWDVLLDQIQQSGGFLPILSDDYRQSQACRAEAGWAEALGVPFVPITSRDQLPGMYEPVIAETNWVLYNPDSRTALADLARGITAVPPVTVPDPLPPRPPIPLSYLITIDRQIRELPEISRSQQLTILSDLRSKLGTRDDVGARELLAALRARADVTYEVATTIDGLLQAPTSIPAAPAPKPPERPRKQPKPPPVMPAPRTEPPPMARKPAAPPPDKATARPAWIPATVIAVVSAAALIALLFAPWITVSSTQSYRLNDQYSRVPSAVAIIAILAVIAAIAFSASTIWRRAGRSVRTLAAVVSVIVAVLAVVGAKAVASSYADTVSWGPWLLAVALVLNAAATVALRPPGRDGTKPV